MSAESICCNRVLKSEATAIGFGPEWDRFSMTIWLFLGPSAREESVNLITGPELTEVESSIMTLPN